MATLNYRLSAKADKITGRCEVLATFYHGNFYQRAKTNIFVLSEYWDDKKQRNISPRFRIMTEENKALAKELSDGNAKLEELANFIRNSFIEAGAGKVELPGKWLADLVHHYNFPDVEENAHKSFFELYRYFIDTRKLSASRKAHFEVVFRALQRFALYSGLDLTVDNITSDTLRQFEKYLEEEHTFYKVEGNNWRDKSIVYLDSDFEKAYKAVPESRLPLPRGGNAISKIMREFRTFWRWLMKHYTDNDPFEDYEIGQCLYGTPYYFTIEERNRLYEFDFSHNPELERQRDIFVFQCLIGCRVSDLKQLKKSSIIDGAIEYIPRKTKEGKPFIVRVPLNSIAREIVDKYADLPGEDLLPFTYEQQYNDDIKTVCEAAGLDRIVTILNPTTREEEKHPIWEVASSHIARRCFIGNLYKQVKDPNLVGKLSGHSEGSKAFARYRDIDEQMTRDLVALLENEPNTEKGGNK